MIILSSTHIIVVHLYDYAKHNIMILKYGITRHRIVMLQYGCSGNNNIVDKTNVVFKQ